MKLYIYGGWMMGWCVSGTYISDPQFLSIIDSRNARFSLGDEVIV